MQATTRTTAVDPRAADYQRQMADVYEQLLEEVKPAGSSAYQAHRHLREGRNISHWEMAAAGAIATVAKGLILSPPRDVPPYPAAEAWQDACALFKLPLPGYLQLQLESRDSAMTDPDIERVIDDYRFLAFNRQSSQSI
ncbi:MAG: hypothetical protein AAGA67_06690 [Cyanobacteria bacterium P01_F01_bin.153]